MQYGDWRDYKHRDYESVDEKSLSQVMSRKMTIKTIQAVKGYIKWKIRYLFNPLFTA